MGKEIKKLKDNKNSKKNVKTVLAIRIIKKKFNLYSFEKKFLSEKNIYSFFKIKK